MQLSVIIVNYNVKYFLEQALLSVRKAAEGLLVETIVVDNNSVDGSVALVREKFPEVIFIANKVNTGFSTANNQGLRIATGKYVLLLNPDTVVEEDTFRRCIDFMEQHPEAGAVGVRMYDGKGIFLPESKRGLPSPSVAFYKLMGLNSLFPRSRTFNYYYLGHLDDSQVQEIEVLSGAFMFMRKSVLDEIGLLDETFFMYGEDIDLSYRILKAGYKNYYLPDTRIIHYKGESTKKGTLNYVRVFYQAMIIFAQKHFSPRQARLYTLGIRAAIYFKGTLTVLSNVLQHLLLPLTDAAIIFLGLWLIKNFWERNIKADTHTTYPDEYFYINVPIYITIWLVSAFLSGGYDRPVRLWRLVRGLLVGTVGISAVYGFLPEYLRFSRGMIVSGMVWAVFGLSALRLLIHGISHRTLRFEEVGKKRAVVVGQYDECLRVQSLLHQAGVNVDLIGFVQPNNTPDPNQFLGSANQLQELVEIYKVNEIIFCARDVPNQQIIQFMIDSGQAVDYKIVPQESLSIIGSNSKNTAGDLYAIDIHLHLNQTPARRNKRLFDLLFSTALLVLLPLAVLFIPHPLQLLRNVWQVFIGNYSWVGYAKGSSTVGKAVLPKIRPGVLSPLDGLPHRPYDAPTLYRLNWLYAKDYAVATDLEVIWRGWKKLGREVVNHSSVQG